jgi:hypothetical protein
MPRMMAALVLGVVLARLIAVAGKPRRVVAKVEWHPGELYPRVGFIVTNLPSVWIPFRCDHWRSRLSPSRTW